MASMTYLHRDSRTGIYHHRRAVPGELRGIVGKGEIKRSLGADDVADHDRARGDTDADREVALQRRHRLDDTES